MSCLDIDEYESWEKAFFETLLISKYSIIGSFLYCRIPFWIIFLETQCYYLRKKSQRCPLPEMSSCPNWDLPPLFLPASYSRDARTPLWQASYTHFGINQSCFFSRRHASPVSPQTLPTRHFILLDRASDKFRCLSNSEKFSQLCEGFCNWEHLFWWIKSIESWFCLSVELVNKIANLFWWEINYLIGFISISDSSLRIDIDYINYFYL